MQRRLTLDIGWLDLATTLVPTRAPRAALEARVAARAPTGSHAVVGLSVRSLFDALLSESNAGTVVMSAVTVADMPALARAHGRRVRTVDIGLDRLVPASEDVRRAAADEGSLFVIAHLYGARAPIGPYADAAPRALLVEDCAQAFDGTLARAPGAAVALYSFGPIKTATALGGAVGLFQDPELAARVRRRMDSWPALPERWFLRRAVKFAALKVLSVPWVYGLFVAGLQRAGKDPESIVGRIARGFSGDRPITDAVRHRPPRRLLRLLERRLRTWRPQSDATPALMTRLARAWTVPGFANPPRRWWLAPLLVPDPPRLVAALRRDGYDATRGATSMRAIEDDEGDVRPHAHRLVTQVVYLPKPRDAAAAARLAERVEAALAPWRNDCHDPPPV